MTRLEIIQKLINKYNFNSYLEIGLDSGAVFNKINVDFKESVDPAEGQYKHAKPTYKMTSDEFFEKYPDKKYDIIFIDGLHESHQVTKDIHNSINALNKGGIVVLHDCNPKTEEAQIVPRQTKMWNGDVWKSFVLFSYYNKDNYRCFTIDTDSGCGVIMEGTTEINYDMPEYLTYEWLVTNRSSALNLVSIEDFNDMI